MLSLNCINFLPLGELTLMQTSSSSNESRSSARKVVASYSNCALAQKPIFTCKTTNVRVISTGLRMMIKCWILLGSVAGPLIQASWVLRMIWGVEACALLCFTVNQHPHWDGWQYGHSGGTQGWLGVGERAIWAVGYIRHLKALFASRSGIC